MAYTYPVASGVYGATPAKSGNAYGYAMPNAMDTEESLQARLLPMLRSVGTQDAGARVAGARRAAMDSSPELTGYAGLNALLSGQGQTARSLNTASLGGLMDRLRRRRELNDVAARQAWEERMARLQHEWQMEQQRSANKSSLWGNVLGAVGTVGGAYLGGL